MQKEDPPMEENTWDYRDPYAWMKKTATSTLPPLVVCCAITGGVQGKEANLNLPETPEEQADQTYEAYKAGASEVHVHVRDPKSWDRGTSDPDQIRLVNRMIRERCPDIIINNTTGGTWGMTVEERMACLEAGPELASLNVCPEMYLMTLKERKPPIPSPRPAQTLDGYQPRTYGEVAIFARAMRERGIKPEIEVWNHGGFGVIQDAIAKGLLDPPYLIQLAMGMQSQAYPTLNNLLGMINELPTPCVYQVMGIGPFQLPMNVAAIILGGHVRVGMEDNLYYARGQRLKSNSESVQRIVRIAHELNREIATPTQAREIMGISANPSQP
jgi:3-keto-5-aminohexanoate cleavage enzyme